VPGRTIHLDGRLDLARTLFPLRRGAGDPTMRIDGNVAFRAARTPDGPATVRYEQVDPSCVHADAWGPGAAWALDRAAAVVGAEDNPGGFHPRHPAVADAWRRSRGVRLTRTGDVLPVLLAAVCEQKVTGVEARRSWRGLARATGQPAPGDAGLLLPPDPQQVVALPSFAFHRFGMERRRAEVIRGLCARASRLDSLRDLPLDRAKATLGAFPGVGAWTVAETARLALGDPDAVSVGDFHVPHLVCWALAGEPRGTDARMLELLAPYEGQRGRVQLLLEASGVRAPRYGPRADVRRIATI
jgi:3-methyladenine DNA glycosylase/8-oxoguanine DNA glycosylase